MLSFFSYATPACSCRLLPASPFSVDSTPPGVYRNAVNAPRPASPTPFQRNVCWHALSGIALLVLICLAAACLFGLGRVFLALEPVLLPVIIAGILAYLLFPCVVWVQRRVRVRAVAVLLVLVLGAAGVAGFGLTIVPPLVKQTSDLIEKRQQILEGATSTGRELLEQNRLVQQGIDMLYDKTVKDARDAGMNTQAMRELMASDSHEHKLISIINFNSSYLTEKGIEWLTAGTRAIYGATAFIIGVVMVPVFLFYFLLKSEEIVLNWHTILPLRDSHFRQELVETLQQINSYIVSFVRGQMLVSLIDGVLLGIALKIMGLPYAITIAAAAALLGIIPYIGMISTSIPALLIAWFTWQDMSHVIGVAAIFVGVSQFDGWLIQPKIVGNRVGMHDLTVMFSVLFWSLVLGGVVGALLAVPLTASIKVIFMRYVWPTLGKKKDGGDDDLPTGPNEGISDEKTPDSPEKAPLPTPTT